MVYVLMELLLQSDVKQVHLPTYLLITYCLYTECSTFGQVRLTDTVTAYYNNGTSGTTGNVEFCNSGTWNGVCQNDLNNSDANIFCQRFGYNSEFD